LGRIGLEILSIETLAYELGDAFRSWCNPGGEDLTEPTASTDLFAATVAGYAGAHALALEPAEIDSLVWGFETLCLELATRFCVDVVEDRYFAWDPARFPSRQAHNLARARGQLGLGRSVARQRAALEAIVRDGIVVLTHGQGLRAVLMVSSLNFALKSEEEQDAIDRALKPAERTR
jgi:hypothetical protein